MSSNEFDLSAKLLEDYDHNFSHSGICGERLASRLSELSKIGLTRENGSNRIGFSLEEIEAKNLVKAWMLEAGLKVKEDGAGNIFGRLEGKTNGPAILSGSHVDSVPNGGHFDGPLGVLAALEVVEAWNRTGYIPTKPYEVVIFTDEEGSRFNGGLTGSQAMLGELNIEKQMQLKDINGDLFEQVINTAGLTLKGLQESKRALDEVESFIEVHIEQGKQLEKANLPVGIVSGIAGPCWLKATFTGEAGHAGNTPMNDRADALVAASQFILRVQELPSTLNSTSVATVGKLQVHPNGVNVIPGRVELTIDIRDIFKESRDQLVKLIIDSAKEISNQWGVDFHYEENLSVDPVPISPERQNWLAQSLKALNIEPFYLPSGAGHDAMILGRYLPVAMLFVRSIAGISHNPKEWTTLNDCVQSVHVLKHYVEQLMDN